MTGINKIRKKSVKNSVDSGEKSEKSMTAKGPGQFDSLTMVLMGPQSMVALTSIDVSPLRLVLAFSSLKWIGRVHCRRSRSGSMDSTTLSTTGPASLDLVSSSDGSIDVTMSLIVFGRAGTGSSLDSFREDSSIDESVLDIVFGSLIEGDSKGLMTTTSLLFFHLNRNWSIH